MSQGEPEHVARRRALLADRSQTFTWNSLLAKSDAVNHDVVILDVQYVFQI